jgi:hypothetical protein
MLEGILHQLGARLQAEVFHDRVFVKGHGACAHMKEVRNFLHRAAFREELQHFALALGELLHAWLHGLAQEDTEGHALGDQRRNVSLARERLLDGGEQLSRRGTLQQIARRAQADRFRRDVGIFIHREEHQPYPRHFSAKFRASVHAVEPRHRDVEHDHIGPGAGGQIDERAAIGRHRRTRDFASILTHYTASTVEGDTTGEEAHVAMTFHPAATAAILQLAFYPINQLRVGKLKRPLARWLTTRMSHNYRQAKRNGFVDQTGYHISLNTILDERGLPREARLRANVESVRAALMEMKERRILAEMMPYGEKLVHAPSKRRPKIVDAIWILYPSPEFVEEIVNGNKEMSIARTQAGGNKGESKLLPGFQDDASRGEIGALFPKEEQDGPLPRKGK